MNERPRITGGVLAAGFALLLVVSPALAPPGPGHGRHHDEAWAADRDPLDEHTWRAIAAGLTTRPLAETVRATLGWFATLPQSRPSMTSGRATASQSPGGPSSTSDAARKTP